MSCISRLFTWNIELLYLLHPTSSCKASGEVGLNHGHTSSVAMVALTLSEYNCRDWAWRRDAREAAMSLVHTLRWYHDLTESERS